MKKIIYLQEGLEGLHYILYILLKFLARSKLKKKIQKETEPILLHNKQTIKQADGEQITSKEQQTITQIDPL